MISVSPSVPATPRPASDYEALAARFRPVFERIAEGALHREQTRELAFEPVAWLRAAGFGAVRIPVEHGGQGASLPSLFRLLIELGEADSNVAHLFRGHFAFLEGRLHQPDADSRAEWFHRVVGGALIGYAMAERGEATGGTATLTRAEDGDGWIIDGVKYYSTGAIYADWIVVSVLDGAERVAVAVPAEAPGVTRVDDWDGFGQRLTGSGTTRFDRVRLPSGAVIRRFSAADLQTQSYQKAFLQLVLLATLAGIARTVLRDAVAFVQPRTRAFGIPGRSSPRADPLVQRVVGRLSSLAFSAAAAVDAAASALEELHYAALSGQADEALYVATEIKAFQAQQIVIPQVLEAATLIFEVGGASATSDARRLDRHWRNARTVASHNPAIHREQAIGDYLLNGTAPDGAWRAALEGKAPRLDSSAEPAAPVDPFAARA